MYNLFYYHSFIVIANQDSKWNVNGLHGQFILKKKEESYWKRLTKEEKKFTNITVDWNKYVDEDEEEEEHDKGLGSDWNPDNMKGNFRILLI